jgi:hypothetical protein
MEFLELNQICEWASKNGLKVDDLLRVQLPNLPCQHHAFYASRSRSGEERSHARDLINRLGGWDECVVWVRQWGVWPSHEDWPAFFAWRGARGGKRSLEVVPGHRFHGEESEGLIDLLQLTMENAWDADVLVSRKGNAYEKRAHISHDDWFEVYASQVQRV